MALNKVLHLPHTLACRNDAKAIAGLLAGTALAVGPAGLLIDEMLRQRTSECRDLFALRGVRTRRVTLLVMAARTLARDPLAVDALSGLAAGQGAMLLRLVAAMVERKLAPKALWTFAAMAPTSVQPKVQAPAAPVVPTVFEPDVAQPRVTTVEAMVIAPLSLRSPPAANADTAFEDGFVPELLAA